MMYPLENGTTEVVDLQSGAVVGYAFVQDGDGPTAQKIQRWALTGDYKEPPRASILLRQPADPARRYTDLNQWANALHEGGLWNSGAGYRYIKVSCVAYSSIIFFPQPHCSEQQLYEGQTTLTQDGALVGQVWTTEKEGWKGTADADLRPTSEGNASADLRHASRSYEHWVLFDSFGGASKSLQAGPTLGGEANPSLQDFLTRMSRDWRAGSSYVICACTSFTTLPGSL